MTAFLLDSVASPLLILTAIYQPPFPLGCGRTLCMAPNMTLILLALRWECSALPPTCDLLDSSDVKMMGQAATFYSPYLTLLTLSLKSLTLSAGGNTFGCCVWYSLTMASGCFLMKSLVGDLSLGSAAFSTLFSWCRFNLLMWGDMSSPRKDRHA